MSDAPQDLTFQTGRWVAGYCVPYSAVFGASISYPQQGIFRRALFGADIAGKNQENDMFGFLFGPPQWTPANHPSVAPFLAVRGRFHWAARAVVYRWRGQTIVRRYTPQDAAPKNNIVPSMLKCMEATAIWNMMGQDQKDAIRDDWRKIRICAQPFNWWVHLYTTDNPRWEKYV